MQDQKNVNSARFDDSDYLRRILISMHDAEATEWQSNGELNDLMTHVINRYANLARKYGFEPEDVAPAAWEAIVQPGTCTATDPWGQITTAVLTALRASWHAEAALCSEETARRGELEGHWVERFSDRETPVWEYDPAFTVSNEPDNLDRPISARAALIAPLFTDLGWPPVTVDAIKAILYRLADNRSRTEAYESLRREVGMAALFGIPRESWRALLRLVLGSPQDPHGITDRGKGILLRLELDEPYSAVAEDDWLTFEILTAAPQPPRIDVSRYQFSEVA